MRARSFILMAAFGSAAAAVVAACSLGLDESKIGAVDGGVDVVTDAPKLDAANPTACQSDPDCKPANTCLTGKCDLTRKVCVYDLCPAAACKASVCDNTSKTCSVPTSYGFHAGSFKVGAGNVGCSGSTRRCFAALYPFVFVGTTNGVVGYSVADPTDANPAALPIAGLPFLPVHIVASGTRIYFVGSVQGSGPNYKLPIGWLDVPGDPTVKVLGATAVFDTVQVTSIDRVLPDGTGGIYMQRDDAAKSFPVARVTAPLKDLEAITFFASPGMPPGTTPVAASGGRLVTFRQEGGPNWSATMGLETSAATSGAQYGGDQSIAPSFGQNYAPGYLGQGAGGALVYNASALDVPDGGPVRVSAVRVGWMLDDDKGTKIEATTRVDVEKYGGNIGPGNDLAGPVSPLDPKRVFVLAASAANNSQTAVQVATRDGTPAVIPNRRFVLPFAPSQLSAVASNGFGYVLVPDANPEPPVVHIFGSGCDN